MAKSDSNKNSRGAWWNAGHHVPRRDNQRGANEGLSQREIRALDRENSRPWGQSIFASSSISDRAKEAQRRARSKAKGKKPVEKREGPLGMQRVNKNNKGWFS